MNSIYIMLLPGLLKQKISDTMDLKKVTFGSLPDSQTPESHKPFTEPFNYLLYIYYRSFLH